MALQLRRGTNAERLAMTPVNGELIFVTDYELVTISVTAIDAGTDTLTSVAHGLAVNQQIKFQDASLNGLILDQVYFVKTVPSSDTFTLSLTSGGATVDITGSFTIPLIFAKTPTTAAGVPLGQGVALLWIGDGVTVGGVFAASFNLDDLLDVEITAVAEGNTLYYDATTGFWRNTAIITVDDVTNNVTLSGDLAVNGGDITNSTTNGNITIATNGTGDIRLQADAVSVGTGSSSGIISSRGAFDLFLQTNDGLNSGSITLTQGVNGAITLSPNGTGTVIVSSDLAVNGGDITTTSANASLFNTNATGIDIGNGASTAVRIGSAAGVVNIKSPSLVQNPDALASTTFNLLNTITTDLNIGGAATTVDIGANSGTMTIGNPTVVGTQTTQAVFNTIATTVNAFGASTATAIGSTVSGTTTIGYDLEVNNAINANYISVDNQATLDSSTLTTTATATVSLNTTTRNAMTGLINIIQGANVHCLNYTVLRVDATTALLTTYAEMYNTSSLASFTADVSSGSLRLRVTPTSATSTVFSVVRTSLT